MLILFSLLSTRSILKENNSCNIDKIITNIMRKMIDGLSLRISEILNETFIDIHGHEIRFEKTGKFEYSSVYNINCNRKYIIDLTSLIVTVNEKEIPRDQVIYSDTYHSKIEVDGRMTNS